MDEFLNGVVKRGRRGRRGKAAATAAAIVLGVGTVGVPAADAAPRSASPASRIFQVRDPSAPVSRFKNGRTVVGRASEAPRAATGTLPAARGTGRRAHSRGVVFTRTFPENVRMLDDGGLRPTSIIGPDGRTPVTTGTTTYPYRASGRLTFVAPNGITYGCTAFLYDDNTVATAGQCVHYQGWNTNFVFWPGQNGASTPYGSCGWLSAHVPAGFPDPEYDYGAVKLDCTIGNTTGWLGLRFQSASYNGTQVNIAGYPTDRPTGTMWQMSGPIAASTVRQLFYSIDVTGGQNGSAVQMPGCGGYCAIAVHAYGLYGGSPYNRGTRITDSAFNNYTFWAL
ncbi:trypsin-like serine peptidase [Thermomonospora umbrina]|uniref:Serine protease n=1 Tax=Thermomonospora umbrina TaxID=111806 RepID=A0A3D9T3T0_9ACTN|nr:trypsin-like serine protease [Thermomonospora umbrina]REE99905.1 V8-like Glu-specific endopeptidase [Thermomonospora umbrina]